MTTKENEKMRELFAKHGIRIFVELDEKYCFATLKSAVKAHRAQVDAHSAVCRGNFKRGFIGL